MAIHSKTNHWKTKKTLIVCVVLIALLVVLAILEKAHVTNFIPTTPSSSDATTQQDNDKKQDTITNENIPTSQNPGSGNTYTPPSTPDAITITPSQPNSSEVVITTKLAGYSDGTCNLKITNGSRTVQQTAKVIYQPEYATCAGFSQSTSALGTGTWSIELTVIAGDSNQSKTVTFTVN